MNFVLLLLENLLLILAAFVSGLTGLGQAIIFQSGWSVLGSSGLEGAGNLQHGVAVTFISALASSVLIGRDTLRAGEIRWDLVAGLTPGSFIFNFIGVAALASFNQAILKKTLGIIFLVFACSQLYSKCKALYYAKQASLQQLVAEHEKSNPAHPSTAFSNAAPSHDPLADSATSLSNIDTVTVVEEHGGVTTTTEVTSIAVSDSSVIAVVEDVSTTSNRVFQRDHNTENQANDYEQLTNQADECDWPNTTQPSSAAITYESTAASVVAPLPPSASPPSNAVEIPDPSISVIDVAPTPNSPPTDSNMPSSSSSSSSSYAPIPQTALTVVQSSGSSTPSGPPGGIGDVKRFLLSPSIWWSTFVRISQTREFRAALIAGSASGFLGGAFGTSGPPVMAFFSMITISKGQVRGTFIWTTLLLTLPKFISLLAFGIFDSSDWLTYLLITPFTLFGTWLGGIAHKKVDVSVVMMILQGLVLLSTVTLVDAFDGSTFGSLMLIIYALIGIALAVFFVYSSSLTYRFLSSHPQYLPTFLAHEDDRLRIKADRQLAQRNGEVYEPREYITDRNGARTIYTVWHK